MAAAAPPSTGSATPVAAPAVPGASRDPAAMTGVSAGDRGSGRPEAAVRPDQVQLGVSASVGHDHWANDVLSAVEEQKEEAAAAAATSSEESPVVQETTATALSPAAKVLERKRKFHSGRALELKNLPDGCTEQVGRSFLYHWPVHPFVAGFSDLLVESPVKHSGLSRRGRTLPTLSTPHHHPPPL